MPYPSRNNSTYTSPSKNSSSSSNSTQSGQNFIEIGEGFLLLVDSVNKLLIENNSQDWSYSAKS